jgi:hypothetical protein
MNGTMIEQNEAVARPVTRIDVEVVISPQPYAGTSRHIGKVFPAKDIFDKGAIAMALRIMADEIEEVS